MIIGEFNDTYPPELDGVGTVVKSYAEELTAMGDECYYVAPNCPKYARIPMYKTLLFHGVKLPGEPYHFGFPSLDFAYLRRENRVPFDIVHAHSPFSAGREALRVARRRGVPIVATFHSKYYDDFYEKTHSRQIASLAANYVVNFNNQCDEVWAVNDRTADVLRIIEAVAAAGAPVALMTYWNPIERYGVDAFARDLAAAGGTGLITPDLIPDEAAEWLAASDRYRLDRTFLVSPSSTDARIEMTVAHCRGFVYATALMGVTGAREQTSSAAPGWYLFS